MKISVTIYNDPTMLGKSKERRRVKVNYAFFVHNGVPEHTGIGFHSWAKATKGQVKAYKKPVHRKARKPIEYFKRAIEQLQPEIIETIKRYAEINVENNRFSVDLQIVKTAWGDIANRVKEVAMNIIREEAFDTGDLMASVSRSEVTITE
jgi:septum formation topological specificity factor MinE